jgi:hypothetical protein
MKADGSNPHRVIKGGFNQPPPSPRTGDRLRSNHSVLRGHLRHARGWQPSPPPHPGVRLRLARGLAERHAKGDVKGVVSDTPRPQRLSDIFVTPGAGMGIQRRAGGGDVRAGWFGNVDPCGLYRQTPVRPPPRRAPNAAAPATRRRFMVPPLIDPRRFGGGSLSWAITRSRVNRGRLAWTRPVGCL